MPQDPYKSAQKTGAIPWLKKLKESGLFVKVESDHNFYP